MNTSSRTSVRGFVRNYLSKCLHCRKPAPRETPASRPGNEDTSTDFGNKLMKPDASFVATRKRTKRDIRLASSC